MTITPADIAQVIKAADTISQKLTPAVASGVLIMDRLDPDQYAALMNRIDADNS